MLGVKKGSRHGATKRVRLRVLNVKSQFFEFTFWKLSKFRLNFSSRLNIVFESVAPSPPTSVSRVRDGSTRVDFRLYRCCWPARAWPSCCVRTTAIQTPTRPFSRHSSASPDAPTRTVHVRWDRRTRPRRWRYDGRRGVTATGGPVGRPVRSNRRRCY